MIRSFTTSLVTARALLAAGLLAGGTQIAAVGEDRVAAAYARADRGELLEAIEDLERAPRPSEPELLARARLEQRAGRFDASAATLDCVLQTDPASAEAQLLRAYADWNAGRLDSARDRLQALARRADDPAASQAAAIASEQLLRLDSQIVGVAPVRAAHRRLEGSFLAAVGACVVALATLLLSMLRRNS